jgi:hypothetical protein
MAMLLDIVDFNLNEEHPKQCFSLKQYNREIADAEKQIAKG